MNNKNKTKLLIDKMVTETKNKTINWDRVNNLVENGDANKLLLNFLEEYDGKIYNGAFMRFLKKQDSYYYKYNSGLVLIVKFEEKVSGFDSNFIAIQGNENAKVTFLNSEGEFKSELIRLQYLIEEQLSDVDGFLDSLFNS